MNVKTAKVINIAPWILSKIRLIAFVVTFSSLGLFVGVMTSLIVDLPVCNIEIYPHEFWSIIHFFASCTPVGSFILCLLFIPGFCIGICLLFGLWVVCRILKHLFLSYFDIEFVFDLSDELNIRNKDIKV